MCPLLDVAEVPTKRLTAKSGWRGGVPLLNFAIELLGNEEILSTPSLSLLDVRPAWCLRKGAICIDVAGQVGIGQKKCPQIVCSCLDRREGRPFKG